jgi:flagellar basal body-associated protein FliL
MSAFSIILLLVWIGLLVLGSVSGYALFSRSIAQNKKANDEKGN